MTLVVGADRDAGNTGRDGHGIEGAGERLFVVVRMRQDPGGEHPAIRRQHVPPVGEMLPARVGMPDGNNDLVSSLATLQNVDPDHVGLSGQRAGERDGGEPDRENTCVCKEFHAAENKVSLCLLWLTLR